MMGKKTNSYGLMFLLGLVLIGLCCKSKLIVEGKPNSRSNFLDVKKKLDYLKKHSIKTIMSQDGDIIDCIDIYKQPAFDHPSLKNHTIQMSPSYDAIVETTTSTRAKWVGRKEKNFVNVVPQIWQRNGSCPKGTVPIRRIREQSLIRANSGHEYGRKKHQFYGKANDINGKEKTYLQLANHSVAILLTVGFSYSGAKGDIKVWNPNVESDDEYSTSQVSLKNGPYYDFESIESGWAVNPSVYGDRQTRIFTYWTVDASKNTGCFDMTCPGFVQTSNEIALGAAIYPISTMGGLPYQITLFIYKDPKTGNWWVQYGERINIGYWPENLFTLLSHNAESVEWGGEVYSSKLGSSSHPHTKTEMGNGQFPDPISAWSGCIRRMRVQQNSLVLKFPDWVSTYTDEYGCYDVTYLGDYIEDPEFFYGGPGRTWTCP